MIAGGAIAVLVVIAVLALLIRRRRRAQALLAPLPLIPFSAGRGGAVPRRPDAPFTSSMRTESDFTTAATPPSAPIQTAHPETHQRSSYAPPPSPPQPVPIAYPSPGNALADTAMPNEPVEGSAVDGASVRYWRPADGTLQFLPGRLEVIAGRDSGQEIRFVRTPGPDGTRVTFGRADGAPYRHVQLREPTVSRTHARMTLENRNGTPGSGHRSSNGLRWRLENLSATNPVVVNGRPLAADGSPACSVSLDEGDRIEMGEVVFRFHQK